MILALGNYLLNNRNAKHARGPGFNSQLAPLYFFVFLLCPPTTSTRSPPTKHGLSIIFFPHSPSFCCVLTRASPLQAQALISPLDAIYTYTRREKVLIYTQRNDRMQEQATAIPPRLTAPSVCSPWQEAQAVFGLITFLERGSRMPPEKVAALKGSTGVLAFNRSSTRTKSRLVTGLTWLGLIASILFSSSCAILPFRWPKAAYDSPNNVMIYNKHCSSNP